MDINEVKFKNENLLQFRKEKGISQEELGAIIGVSRQTIYKWETGEIMPDMNNLIVLCKEFNKKLEDFIEGADELLQTEQIKRKKKFNLKKIIIFLVIAIIFLYILSVVIKAIFINVMLLKMNKYKEAKEYYYIAQTNYYFGENNSKFDYYRSKIIYFKDKVQKVVEYDTNQQIGVPDEPINPDDDAKTIKEKLKDIVYSPYFKNTWSYTNSGELFEVTGTDDEKYNRNFYLHISIPYMEPTESSPYDLTCKKIKELYTLSFILNPLNILKIDLKNNDLIFETEYKSDSYKYSNPKEKTFIDMKKGLLSKEEKYQGELLTECTEYNGYKFEGILDEDVFLTEEEKNDIKEKHRIESEEYNRLMQQK